MSLFVLLVAAKIKLPVCFSEVFPQYNREQREITANCQLLQRVWPTLSFNKTEGLKIVNGFLNPCQLLDLLDPLGFLKRKFPNLLLFSSFMYSVPVLSEKHTRNEAIFYVTASSVDRS